MSYTETLLGNINNNLYSILLHIEKLTMTDSTFDPSAFLDSQTTEVQVKLPPLTAGIELNGVIGEVKADRWQGKKDPTQSGLKFTFPVEFDLTQNQAEATRLGVAKVIIQETIMLQLNAEGTGIDYGPGKNSRLRQYREATGLNEAGTPFSARMFQGRVVKCKIKHEPYDGEIFNKIDGVAKPR